MEISSHKPSACFDSLRAENTEKGIPSPLAPPHLVASYDTQGNTVAVFIAPDHRAQGMKISKERMDRQWKKEGESKGDRGESPGQGIENPALRPTLVASYDTQPTWRGLYSIPS